MSHFEGDANLPDLAGQKASEHNDRTPSATRIGLVIFGLVAIAILLAGASLVVTTRTLWRNHWDRQAIVASEALESARTAAEAESSTERSFREKPSDALRHQHKVASAQVTQALEDARTFGDPADRLEIAALLAEHAQYVHLMGVVLQDPDQDTLLPARAIEPGNVASLHDKLIAGIATLGQRHSRETVQDAQTTVEVQSLILAANAAGFALALGLGAWLWQMVQRRQRKESVSLVREALTQRLGERRYRGLVQGAADLVLICAGPGNIVTQNPAGESVWRYPPDGMVGRSLLMLTHPDDQEGLRALWSQLPPAQPEAAGGVARRIELRLLDGTGKWRPAELTLVNLMEDPAIAGVSVMVRDVTARRGIEQELTRQALFDRLTRLPNRVLVRDRLSQALVRSGRHKESVGVIVLDLDGFDRVNQTAGTDAGDRLLVEVSGRIRACLRAYDTVGRLGGDEFVIVRELTGGETEIKVLAGAIADQFSRNFLVEGREAMLSVSMGLAIGNSRQHQADGLLLHASVAMTRAKGTTRERRNSSWVMFEPGMHSETFTRNELESDLRRLVPLLGQPDQQNEIFLEYQPIVDMGDSRLRGVEALVRWQHTTYGLVSPNDFIPIAEKSGAIVPLGRWVLENACRQLMEWQTRHRFDPPLILSVNLSPRQFCEANLVEDVGQALEAAGLSASSLKLEITEGTLMADVTMAVQRLWALKELGVQLAIDDFGSGYSSVAFLKQLPLGLLKIDNTFVHGIGQDEEDTATVRAVVALARSLEWTVTAEGIETAEQAALLRQWGCDYGQGYLFSKPLDCADAGQLMRRTAEGRIRMSLHPASANQLRVAERVL